MALTGLDIYKLLPKTNCGKCGVPTCLAFAMKVAQKKASIDECPYVDEKAKQALAEASEPPIRTITVGAGEYKKSLGGEVVLFRHEKTFYNPTGLGITLSDTLSDGEILQKIDNFNNFTFDRVGKKEKVEFLAIKEESGSKERFCSVVNKIKSSVQQPTFFILISKNVELLGEGIKVVADQRPIIGIAEVDSCEQYVNLAKMYNNLPLIVRGKDVEELSAVSQKAASLGYRELILSPGEGLPQNLLLEALVQIRRLALKKNFRPLGYPVIVFVEETEEFIAAAYASQWICKYASIVIFNELESYQALPLVTLRQNIYTDPQKPVVVEPKLYSIGGQAKENSPLLVTTNFSLTYYTVEPEIINSKIPSWLLVVDTEGLSVLTAWAAEKFTPEVILQSMKKENIDSKVAHRKIIIPGYVAIMSGKLSELTGYEVIVGPREASGIPKFLRTFWKT